MSVDSERLVALVLQNLPSMPQGAGAQLLRDTGQALIAQAAFLLGYDDDVTIRPTADCGCGFPLVWVAGHWEHDAAPYLWGDDHDPDAPEPTGPARDYWDSEDGVTEDDDEPPGSVGPEK